VIWGSWNHLKILNSNYKTTSKHTLCILVIENCLFLSYTVPCFLYFILPSSSLTSLPCSCLYSHSSSPILSVRRTTDPHDHISIHSHPLQMSHRVIIQSIYRSTGLPTFGSLRACQRYELTSWHHVQPPHSI